MFERLIISGGSRVRPPLAPVALSVLVNAALAYAAAVTTRPGDAPTAGDAPAAERVVYLIPPPPQRVPFEEIGLEWAGGEGPGIVAAPLDEASLLAVPAGGERGAGAGRRGGKERRGRNADSLLAAGELDGGTVYVASELDQPVSFDPTSAAPAYPVDLQLAGIEGSATMRFVVDTTGSADSTTIEQVAATHPGFAASAREALPRMHFRPAELGARRVRQLVEQQFKFQLSPVAATPAAATPDSAIAPDALDEAAAIDSGAAAGGGAAPGDSAP